MGDNLESNGDEGVCNTLRFRCLLFTRSAVALVVTVLAAIVVFKAVGLILHPNKLQLSISPSDVYVNKFESPVYTGGKIYEYIFRFYLEAKNPSERDFIYYSNITVLLKQGDNSLIANFSLTAPSSMPLSQQEEQEYFVYGYADHQQVNTSLFNSTIFKDDAEATMRQKIDGAVMTLNGIIRENQEGSTNTYRRATYDCESVAVGRTLPRPSSSDSHKGKCGSASL